MGFLLPYFIQVLALFVEKTYSKRRNVFVRIAYTKFQKQIVLSKQKTQCVNYFEEEYNYKMLLHYINFRKRGTQKLIHQLKYEGGESVGVFLGKQLGYALKESSFFSNINYIIPVPLHPKKENLRGYNQSNYIAKGIQEILQIKVNTKVLIRTENTDSQTRKKRFSRWGNMMNSFALKMPEKLIGTHILLVDDVVTTGATLEACAQKLLEIEGVRVSIATIAITATALQLYNYIYYI